MCSASPSEETINLRLKTFIPKMQPFICEEYPGIEPKMVPIYSVFRLSVTSKYPVCTRIKLVKILSL